MTEPQVRGTDRNEAAANLRAWLRRYAEEMPATARSAEMTLDDALDWERRRTVERVRERLVEVRRDAPFTHYSLPPVDRILDEVAALDPATPGEEAEDDR